MNMQLFAEEGGPTRRKCLFRIPSKWRTFTALTQLLYPEKETSDRFPGERPEKFLLPHRIVEKQYPLKNGFARWCKVFVVN